MMGQHTAVCCGMLCSVVLYLDCTVLYCDVMRDRANNFSRVSVYCAVLTLSIGLGSALQNVVMYSTVLRCTCHSTMLYLTVLYDTVRWVVTLTKIVFSSLFDTHHDHCLTSTLTLTLRLVTVGGV